MTWNDAAPWTAIVFNAVAAAGFTVSTRRLRRNLDQAVALNLLLTQLAARQFDAAWSNAHWWRAWAGTMGRIDVEVTVTNNAADKATEA